MMSGIHEGKEKVEENTVELLRDLVSSDDEETSENVPQVPVEQVGLAGGVGEKRPTWGKAAPGPAPRSEDDEDNEDKIEQDFYSDLKHRILNFQKDKRIFRKTKYVLSFKQRLWGRLNKAACCCCIPL